MAPPNSDIDVVARERVRVRRLGYLQCAGIVFLFLLTCWTYLPSLETWRLAADPYDFYVMAACLAVMLVYGLIFVGVPSAAARSERLIPRQIDGYLAQARWQWLLLLAILSGGVAGSSRLVATIEEGVRVGRLPENYFAHSGILAPAATSVLLIGYALSFALPLTWFRKAFNQTLQDELVRELRAQALKIGYIGAVAVMAAGYVVIFMTSISPLQFMLWSTYAVVALPVLAYVALEARAGRSD